ncbi:MAG: helix-turn-helix domain-containing protein [Chloroflexota bacterium]
MRMITVKTYYRVTTVQQRKLLFRTWEETGNVTLAAQKAKVSRGTFYNWQERYEKNGFAGLEKYGSKAPKKTRKVSKEIEEKVIEKRRKNPKWGKQRIADEMMKENEWQPVVSANTVRRILEEAGLWGVEKAVAGEKNEGLACRHAERADQSYNVDLCYVPATHESEEKLPAVSGSSGRLKVEKIQEESSEKTWPGRVFEDQTVTYEEAMKSFVERSRGEEEEEEEVAISEGMKEKTSEQEIRKAERRALNQESDELRIERRKIRINRHIEDDAWREMRVERKESVNTHNALSEEQEQMQEKEAKKVADTE